MSVFRNLLMKVSGWLGKPADWSDIRKDCPDNSIALYAGVKSDFSKYDNLGFIAICTGGYNVFIDGTQYGTTYASGAQCNITWSTSGIATGDDITTPSALEAHKIWISPATEGAEITKFCCRRVAASGVEEQGVLWAHFNISNAIGLDSLFLDDNYKNTLVTAVTAKGNKINITSQYSWASGLYQAFCDCELLEYLPTLNTRQETNVSYYRTFRNCAKLTSVKLTQGGSDTSGYELFSDSGITEIKGNFTVTPTELVFYNCQDITKLPAIDATNSTNCVYFITNAENLEDTVLDMRAATGLTAIGCYGTAEHFMGGFKGLRVSSSAPFSGSEAQINVSYTGMTRQAIVTLFNDLPTVSAGQIINITGCTGASSLIDSEVEIATNKGWTVAGGPAFQVFATYSGASVGDTIKLNDGMATSDYTWSAYPSDTAITGDYTQTATVTAVDGNLLECEKPTETSYNATITTDETSNIEVIDNTTIQTVTITSDQTATIETTAGVTKNNNDVVITDGSYKLFNLTIPTGMTAVIESNGMSYQTSDMPLFLKKNSGVGLLIKDGDNAYYRNTWVITRDYDLHYQQINFSYPSGSTVTCKVNNVLQNDLTPICYCGDVVSWTCDNAGTITTGTYTVKYSNLDGNIQTITIS